MVTPASDVTPWYARLLRAAEEPTEIAIAARLGVSRGALAGWKSGRRMPSADALVGIADSVGVSLDWLLTGRGRSGRPDIDGPDMGAASVPPRAIPLAGYAAADSSMGSLS